MNRYFERLWRAISFPDHSSEPDRHGMPPRQLPVIWLLGKTAAGKSSLIRCLTGIDGIELGNGFEACTRTAVTFDFPRELPLMRFLDTRGLGEVHYDPSEDLEICRNRSHVVLVVARLDDPVQGQIAEALSVIHEQSPQTRLIVVHNGINLVPDPQERFRARSQTQLQFEQACRSTLPFVEVDLSPGQIGIGAPGIGDLMQLLDGIMPDVALLLAREELRDFERRLYEKQRSRIIWYASAAGATDLAPVVGAVTVPSIQAAMLRALGESYGVTWTRDRMKEFALALGAGIASRFGGSYLARQLAKLVPVYGQTLGAATAGTLSFASTYALGRAASYYLHRVVHGHMIDHEEIRNLYRDALRSARKRKL